MAAGTDPALLAETGPRELADLAHHFNHMAAQVRDLLDARTTLLAGISHDLRTPLARMRVALEMLSLQPTPELIARLERDVEEMNALIGQMLTLARGMSAEERQTLPLADWLRERAELAGAPGSTLHVECPPDLTVEASPGVLARILDNLLGNAIRYAPGSIEVVARRIVEDGHSAVRVGVLDRGPGIPPAQMEAVWRPFHRLEDSRSDRTGGHGLGLALVQQLAKAQGWQVGMEAREGGGLHVWVQFAQAPA
jgi:two-component system osmolarity sensor histidine kinase EnvZ